MFLMVYKAEIGRRIKQARNARGLSLEALSQRTSSPRLSSSRISNYEQGTRTPGPAEINALGRALDVDAAYLMCLQQNLTQQEIELLRNWRALPENDRNSYARRIEVLALAHREPVPDERLTQAWSAPKLKKRAVK